MPTLNKIQELTGDEDNPNSRTFVILDENHTLGNVLKNIIGSYSEVTFCGYTIPHPTENKLHFRIQTNRSDLKAIDVLRRGFKDLEQVADLTLNAFTKELNKA